MLKTLPPSGALLTRCERVLQREVEACEDPVCCCEAEPRWVRFGDGGDGGREASEWEVIERSPRDEL